MRVFWSILLMGLAACGFNPHPQNGALPCDNGCPSGYHCAIDGTCRTTDLGADASSPSDGRAERYRRHIRHPTCIRRAQAVQQKRAVSGASSRPTG
jgi:hypothetical protein